MSVDNIINEICLMYGLSGDQVRLVLSETNKRIPEFLIKFGETLYFHELCKYQMKHYEAMQRINAHYD